MKLLTRSNDPNTGLGVAERSAYMIGNLGTALVNTIIASFLMFYYTDVLMLNAGIIGTILLFSRVFDGVSDIIMGFVVDHTKSKHGKARVWVLRAAVPFAISGILLMTVPTNSPLYIQYIYVLISYNIANTLFLTMLYVPYNAMVVNITRNPYERGLLGIFAMLGAVIGTLAVQSTVDSFTKSLGGDAQAWQIVIAVYAVVGLIFHLICFFFTKERVTSLGDLQHETHKLDVKRELKALFSNVYWLLAIGTVFIALFATNMLGGIGMYFAKAVLGDTAYYATFANAIAIPQLLMLFVSFIFIKKFGKRNVMFFGMIVWSLSSLIQAFVGPNLSMIVILSAFKGVGAGLAAGGIYGLVADTIDYGEWKTGIKSEGVGMGAVTFATKLSAGLSVVLIGWLIEFGGYSATAAVQSERAILTINFGYNIVPMLFTAVASLLLYFYKLDKIFPQIQKDLESRRLASQEK